MKKPCAPGKHSRKSRKRTECDYAFDGELHPIIIEECGDCGSWRFARRHAADIRGPFSKFHPGPSPLRKPKRGRKAA